VATVTRVARDLDNILPQLLAFCLGPTVIALENGNHELRDAVDDLRERSIDRFHSYVPRPQNTKSNYEIGVLQPRSQPILAGL
jgi:hypothetical protein